LATAYPSRSSGRRHLSRTSASAAVISRRRSSMSGSGMSAASARVRRSQLGASFACEIFGKAPPAAPDLRRGVSTTAGERRRAKSALKRAASAPKRAAPAPGKGVYPNRATIAPKRATAAPEGGVCPEEGGVCPEEGGVCPRGGIGVEEVFAEVSPSRLRHDVERMPAPRSRLHTPAAMAAAADLILRSLSEAGWRAEPRPYEFANVARYLDYAEGPFPPASS